MFFDLYTESPWVWRHFGVRNLTRTLVLYFDQEIKETPKKAASVMLSALLKTKIDGIMDFDTDILFP